MIAKWGLIGVDVSTAEYSRTRRAPVLLDVALNVVWIVWIREKKSHRRRALGVWGLRLLFRSPHRASAFRVRFHYFSTVVAREQVAGFSFIFFWDFGDLCVHFVDLLGNAD